MNELPHLGDVIATNARLYPGRPGARDSIRELTFREWDGRANRLANALLGLGLVRGDRLAVLARNAIEWVEVYAAAARAGLVAVPVNFRLAAPEVQYILEDSGARALIVQAGLTDTVEAIRGDLLFPDTCLVCFGGDVPGYRGYEALLADAADTPPGIVVNCSDPWTLMYTSGTTGRPKGAIRSHRSYAHFYLLNAVEFGFQRDDVGLLVMPMCHVNSVFYTFAFTWLGAAARIYDRPRFDAEDLLRTIATERATFVSLVPTHCTMIDGLSASTRAGLDTTSLRTLLVSSAPARRETKLAMMEQFPNTRLFEGYGSTEAGLVTLLRPEEQFDHLGSIGREIVGTYPIRLLDDDGGPVAPGEVGELWARTPTLFEGYFGRPEKTAAAFRDGYCGVGDMARCDEHGFFELVDRKHNMIISGGENVYPSEVEVVIATHPDVRDVAVIGLPDERWGEQVTAVVVLREGNSTSPDDVAEYARGRIAGYKRPRRVITVADADMPRTATGKILHRALRDRFTSPIPGPTDAP